MIDFSDEFDDSPFFDPHQIVSPIPSGIHIGVPYEQYLSAYSIPEPDWNVLRIATSDNIQLCNPMTVEKGKVEQTDEISKDSAPTFLRGIKGKKLVRQRDLTEYGELLSNVAKWLLIRGYHGIVVPLRGGLKPWLQVDAITEFRFSSCWLPFTQGANNLNIEQIRHFLGEYLRKTEEVSLLKLAVVDTANSGDSALSLASIIRSLKKDSKDERAWEVDFILFFEPGPSKRRFPPKSRSIPKLSRTKLLFRVFACGTPSLIVEDWDQALGIQTVWADGNRPQFLIVPSKGQLIVEDFDGRLREFEAERLDLFTDQLLATEASDAVLCDLSLTFKEDVWEKYLIRPRSENQDSGETETDEGEQNNAK